MNGLDIRSLVGVTLRNPGDAARQILQADLPMPARWLATALVATLAGVLAAITATIAPLPEGSGELSAYAWIWQQPLLLAGLQLAGLVLTAATMTAVGRMFGGQGDFADALILTAWVEAVLLLIQLVQIVLLPIAPGFSAMLSLAAAGMFFYLTVQFTKVLHGFRNGWKVFLIMLVTIFALGFLLSIVAAAFGLLPEVVS